MPIGGHNLKSGLVVPTMKGQAINSQEPLLFFVRTGGRVVYCIRLESGRALIGTEGSNPSPSANFNMILKWFKSVFSDKVPIKAPITKSLLEGMITGSSSLLSYRPQAVKCKIHWEYKGLAVPTNNCNTCWEYYSQKYKNRQIGRVD